MNSSTRCEPPATAFVAFGANLGDPRGAYADAIGAIRALPGTQVRRYSSLYLSAPVGVSGQPDYTNGVLEVETALSADELLAALLHIEHLAGRTRASHCAARVLDLDLLLYGERTLCSPSLQIPHPRMHERAFVLVPLAEIAPEIVIPGRGRVGELLATVSGQTITRFATTAPRFSP